MSERLLFIDTETGGLDPGKHSLLSLAMVVWDDGKIIDSKEILINDGVLSVTKEALAINRIDIEKHKETAIPSSLAISGIFSFTGMYFSSSRKITLAGHNVHFDIAFLNSFLSANHKNFSEYFSHRVIDTASILHYLYLSGRLKERAVSSDKAFAHFDIKVEGRHTALGDAIATAELFNRLLEMIK